MDPSALLVYLPSLFLHVARAGGFVFGMPLFGTQRTSRLPRIVLSLALGTIFWWVGDKAVPAAGLTAFAFLAVREVFVGILLGFAVNLMTALLATAGEVISHEMGFAMARVVNPATGRNSPVVSQLLGSIAVLLMFALDLHHEAIRVLGFVYEVVPVGRGFDLEPVVLGLQRMIGTTLEMALRYSIPVLGVMVLLTATLVVLARAVPNINLLEFSFGLRILLALLASVYFLAGGVPVLGEMLESLLVQARALFAGA